MTTDIMVDLETLGTKPSAAVVAIGACRFDINRGTIDTTDTFYRNIHMGSALRGRSVDAGTLGWWLEQEDDARLELTKGTSGIGQSVTDFVKWLPYKPRMWGKGPSFDVTILEDLCRQYAIEIPWDFWSVRCVRTLIDASSHLVKLKDFTLEGTAHNALDDAVHQATYCNAMWKKLKEVE